MWNLKSQHHHSAPTMSKRQSPAVKAAAAHHQGMLSPIFKAAFACRCPPSQLLLPAVTVAVAAVAFTCRFLLLQLPSPAVTAAVASCRLLLSSAPLDHCVVGRPLELHCSHPPMASSPLTLSLFPPPTPFAPVARRAVHRPLLLSSSSMLLPSRVSL